MQNKDLNVHNGKNKVDFTYRGDAAQGIIDVALSKIHNTSFNITYGNAITLQKAAEEIVKITNSKFRLLMICSLFKNLRELQNFSLK